MKLLVLFFTTFLTFSAFAVIQKHGSVEAINKHIDKRLQKAEKAYEDQMDRLSSRKNCFTNYSHVFGKMGSKLTSSYEGFKAAMEQIRAELSKELSGPLAELDAQLAQAKETKFKSSKKEYKAKTKKVKELQKALSDKVSDKFNIANEKYITMDGLLDIPLRRTHKVNRKEMNCNLTDSQGNYPNTFDKLNDNIMDLNNNGGKITCKITGSYRNQFGTLSENKETTYTRKVSHKDLKKLSKRGISQNTVNKIAKQDAISNHKNTAGNLFDICKSEKYPKGTADCVYLVGKEFGHWAAKGEVTNMFGNIPLTKDLNINSKKYDSINMKLRIKQLTKASAEQLPVGAIPNPTDCIAKKKKDNQGVFNKMRGWFEKKRGGDTVQDDGLNDPASLER
jgi:hypothetical protein